MKVFVLIGGWDYEGHDYPVGVFTTKEKAESAKDAVVVSYSDIDIVEYDLDDPITVK